MTGWVLDLSDLDLSRATGHLLQGRCPRVFLSICPAVLQVQVWGSPETGRGRSCLSSTKLWHQRNVLGREPSLHAAWYLLVDVLEGFLWAQDSLKSLVLGM